jgi:hypothetical protein
MGIPLAQKARYILPVLLYRPHYFKYLKPFKLAIDQDQDQDQKNHLLIFIQIFPETPTEFYVPIFPQC